MLQEEKAELQEKLTGLKYMLSEASLQLLPGIQAENTGQECHIATV